MYQIKVYWPALLGLRGLVSYLGGLKLSVRNESTFIGQPDLVKTSIQKEKIFVKNFPQIVDLPPSPPPFWELRLDFVF